MLALQRPNNSMDADFSHGVNPSPYDHERRLRTAAWGEQVPYSASYPSDATTQLPPIQTQRTSYDQTPTSYDPVRRPAPIPTTMAQSYSPYAAQPPQSPYGHGMPQYQPNPHMFNQSAPQMSPMSQQYPTSTGYSPIRPMPAPVSGQPHMAGGYATSANYSFPQPEEPDPQPRLHVVGSQGRRGVLPSDEGRPPAISNGATGTKSSVIPQKDADGKFPCPHCQKTYLHGKHLKRHLLRHTGDRPYSCFLCQDTFSRSDILKRHFQKCSQRRGNPTGASHLAYSQNHLKRQAAKAKQQAAQQGGQGVVPSVADNGGLPSVTQAGMNNNNTPAPIYGDSHVGMSTMNATQHQLADISTKPYGDGRDPSNRSGGILSPGLNRPNHNFLAGQPGPASLPSSGSSTPLTAKTTTGQFPQTYQSDPSNRSSYPDMANRNHLPQMSGGNQFDGNSFEWSSAYPHGKDTSGSVFSDDHLAGQSFYQSINSDSQQEPFKTINPRGGFHDGASSRSGLRPITQAKVDQLFDFCQLHTQASHNLLDFTRQLLTPTNIDHFVQQYFANFYQHFPISHIPTFDPNTMYDGLVLAISCTGAVYSDRLGIEQTREWARLISTAIRGSSPWFEDIVPDIDLTDNSIVDEISEQLHAYIAILSLILWHDEDQHKIQVMEDWSRCTKLAIKLRLNEPVPKSNSRFSFFHQPGFVEDQTATDFFYDTWLWQEKRIRLMYIIFLTDAVLAFFFNREPTLDPLQLKLPLPSDDAVWDASGEEECIKALGFYGSQSQALNTTGSLRKKQPEMHLALAVLQSSDSELVSRSTNVAGKFLLIHGLLVQFWKVQRFSTLSSIDSTLQDLDWVVQSKVDPSKGINSSSLGIVEAATDKWIKSWESDISIQYPPGVERIGYSRDGVHYYWLAKLLIQNCDFINVHSPWNERFHQILKILKNVKTWVSGNQLTRGESTGAVNLVDERYGLEDLSKDLKLLLAPQPFHG